MASHLWRLHSSPHMSGAADGPRVRPKPPSVDDQARQIAQDRARALDLIPVSRETLSRLDRSVELLLARNQITNLIANSTVPHVWTRRVTPTHFSSSR